MKDHVRRAHLILIVLFFGGLLFLGLLTQIQPPLERSFIENRLLAQRPVPSVKTILNGSFERQYESYITDQFIIRDLWFRAWIYLQLLSRRTLVHGFYIDPENWILQDVRSAIPDSAIRRSAEIINTLCRDLRQRGKTAYFVIVPHKSLALMPIRYPDYLRTTAPDHRRRYFLDHLDRSVIRLIPVHQELLHNRLPHEIEAFYFRTDHHWKADTAFKGYAVVVNHFIRHGYPLKAIRPGHYALEYLAINNFVGSWNRQLFRFVPEEREMTWVRYRLQDYRSFRLYMGPAERDKRISWDEIYLNVADKRWVAYGDFFTWDFRHLTIENDKAPCPQHILIVKDSYFNPLTVHVPEQFRKTTIVDPRHWLKGDARTFILNSDAATVIFFVNDTNVSGDTYDSLE